MDFWARQNDAKSRTTRFILLYALFLIIFAAVAAGILDWLWYEFAESRPVWKSGGWVWLKTAAPAPSQRYPLFLALTIGVIWLLTQLSPASLRAGGKSVAESLGGELLLPQSQDWRERRLLNIVEEISLASGVPVPPVYVMKEEKGINAFAAGAGVNDAVIGVTRGALDYLERDELQGVIAHEFSHILNGDMRLNLRFAKLLFGLMCLATVGQVIMRGLSRARPRGKDAGKGLAMLLAIGLFCWLVGIITHLMGRIIQAAVSRQREFLADASAVQFTRSPALAGALAKIANLEQGSRLENPKAAYSHLFFSGISSSLFSSHPPLAERIRRIEPGWAGIDEGLTPLPVEAGPGEIAALFSSQPAQAPQAGLALLNQHSLANAQSGFGSRLGLVGVESKPTAGPGDLPDQSSCNLCAPAEIDEQALSQLAEASHQPLDASYLIYALLLDKNPAVRGRQLALLSDQPEVRKRIRNYACAFSLVQPGYFIPLIEMSAPALRSLPREQYHKFEASLLKLILADQVFTFREWVLYQLVVSLAGRQFSSRASRERPHFPLTNRASLHLLGTLARLPRQKELPQTPQPEVTRPPNNTLLNGWGTDYAWEDLRSAKKSDDSEEQQILAAFRAGAAALMLPDDSPLPPPCTPAQLSGYMEIMERASPWRKDKLLLAAHKVALHDGVLEPEEAMLLRLFALCLGRPLPPPLAQDLDPAGAKNPTA